MLYISFSIDQGATQPINVTVNNVDLTAAQSIKWYLRSHAENTDILSKDLDSGISVISSTKFSFTLSAAETAALKGSYFQKAEVVDFLGNTTPVMSGTLQVTMPGSRGMKLGDAKTKAIQLINEYSNNGNVISSATNADYSLRFPMLADDCQSEISDRCGIDTSYTLGTPVTENGYNKFAVPSDFKEHQYIRLADEAFYDYRIENGVLLIPVGYTGTFVWGYYKYPSEINGYTPDNYEFETEAHTHRMIPYYLAGMVIADEKQDISNKLLNIYYEQLNKIRKRSNMVNFIENVNGW